MFDYTPHEWAMFSKTEKKIIILIRQYNINRVEQIPLLRLYLNWPLPYPVNARTFKSQHSRLLAKMAIIKAGRLKEQSIASAHDDKADIQEIRNGDDRDDDGGMGRAHSKLPKGGRKKGRARKSRQA